MKNFIIIIVLSSLSFSCEKKIDWEVKEDIRKLVVDASITNEFKKHAVKLSKTNGFGEGDTKELIQNATIKLTDGNNTYNYIEDENNPGFYYTENEIKGVIGKTYTLDIELEREIDGQFNYSASATMKPVFELDSLIASYDQEIIFNFFGFDDTSTYCGIKITAQELQTEGDRYMFKLRNNGVLLTDSLGELLILTDENINNFQFTEKILFYEDTTEIKLNDTVTVEVHSIHDTYLDFLQYYRQAQRGGDPLGLSGPPANVPSNISNGGLGFFVVSAVSKKSAIVFDNLPIN